MLLYLEASYAHARFVSDIARARPRRRPQPHGAAVRHRARAGFNTVFVGKGAVALYMVA
jgi:hypothetical protein